MVQKVSLPAPTVSTPRYPRARNRDAKTGARSRVQSRRKRFRTIACVVPHSSAPCRAHDDVRALLMFAVMMLASRLAVSWLTSTCDVNHVLAGHVLAARFSAGGFGPPPECLQAPKKCWGCALSLKLFRCQ
eukprot:7744841-Pyramimonas_sp.AAC.1